MERRQCICCRARFTPTRNPDQRYCAKSPCQKKRRCKYQKQKLAQDADYRANQRASEQNWHKRHPNYWQHYRKNRPHQIIKNRNAQYERDKKRRRRGAILYSGPMLATMYSFNQDNFYLSCSYNTFLSNASLLATIGRYGNQGSCLLLSAI
jgi:hypothetical protein